MRLVSFSLKNFRSFLEIQRICFGRAGSVDAIFGANGSGKSSLFAAMLFYRNFILNSTNYIGQNMHYPVFALRDDTEKMETSFEAEMQVEDKVYKYAFSLVGQNVVDEKLKFRLLPDAHYTTIFSRKSIKNNQYADFGFPAEIMRDVSDRALILTYTKFNKKNAYANDVFGWLECFNLISGSQPTSRTAERIMNDEAFKQDVLLFLRRADFSIHDLSVSETIMPEAFVNDLPFADDVKRNMVGARGYRVATRHIKRTVDGNKVSGMHDFNMSNESTGTRRMFELSYPILDTLEHGKILYIDEFESTLHPLECQFIIELFRSRDENPHGAQLIVNTHNTPTLRQVGRDGAHFVGKNAREESIIGEISKDLVRSDDQQIDRKYLKNTFGYVPEIGW